MTDLAMFLAAVLLAVTFAWAGGVKIVWARRWFDALSTYRIPKPLEPLVFVAVPVAEIATAGLILIGASKPAGALSAALLCAFCAALLRARRREGDRLPCGCFGGEKVRDYRLLLMRNLTLLLPAIALMLAGNNSIRDIPGSGEPLPFLFIGVGVGVIAWTTFEVSRALRRGRNS